MATWAIIATIGLYCLTALDLFNKGDWPMAGAFLCYAVANGFFAVIALR